MSFYEARLIWLPGFETSPGCEILICSQWAGDRVNPHSLVTPPPRELKAWWRTSGELWPVSRQGGGGRLDRLAAEAAIRTGGGRGAIRNTGRGTRDGGRGGERQCRARGGSTNTNGEDGGHRPGLRQYTAGEGGGPFLWDMAADKASQAAGQGVCMYYIVYCTYCILYMYCICIVCILCILYIIHIVLHFSF